VFNLEAQQLLHRHGNEWVPMEPVAREHSSPADHDVERELLSGRTVFRCKTCNEEICIDGASEG
jgi:hypothetical protein